MLVWTHLDNLVRPGDPEIRAILMNIDAIESAIESND